MVTIDHIHILIIPVITLIILWGATNQFLALMLAQIGRRSLLAWSLGLNGISAIYLRKPAAITRFLQLLVPLGGAALAAYAWLMVAHPAPIAGLPPGRATNIALATIETLVFGSPHLWGAVRELRFPLWGEARFIDRVARGQHPVVFTATGRAYLRERFGASPEEFLRIVRRHPGSLASGM
jgi:hypothetical protein